MVIDKENRPLCKCHNIEMLWHKKNDRKSGGSWQCRIKQYKSRRLHDKKYSQSIVGYTKRRRWKLNKMREENLQRLKQLQEENPWLTN